MRMGSAMTKKNEGAPASGVQLRSDLSREMLDDLADAAAISVGRCFVKGAKRSLCVETAANLRELATMVRHADMVLAATAEGCAESIEAMIGAEEIAS
jgi:hypothetical protein